MKKLVVHKLEPVKLMFCKTCGCKTMHSLVDESLKQYRCNTCKTVKK